MMHPCPGGPGNHRHITARGEEDKTMFPGLNEADCRVAEFHYRQMVTEGQRQQAAAGVRAARTGNIPAWVNIRGPFGRFLVRVGQRLQEAYVGKTQRKGPATATERAVA
jgi:hypothetical protein